MMRGWLVGSFVTHVKTRYREGPCIFITMSDVYAWMVFIAGSGDFR